MAVATAIVLAALAGGCGAASSPTGQRPAVASGPDAKALTPQGSTGRLAGAVVARPGSTQLHGGLERIAGKSGLRPPASGNGVGAEASCADTDVQPTPDNLGHVSDVIFCLMNAMRANAGLPPLAQQDQLARASIEHSQDMVDQKYFAHDSLDGRDVVARLTNVGYIPKSGQWVIGENLVWGSGTLATPAALVNAWMNSPPHRANLLASDFREVGMGVVFGTPSAGVDSGATVTTDFGTRPVPQASASAPATATATSHTTQRTRALRRCARRHGRLARRRCVHAARVRYG